MIFLGLRVDEDYMRLETALVDVREGGTYKVINERAAGIPAEIVDSLEAIQLGLDGVLAELGQLHQFAGTWMGEEAAALMRVSGVPLQGVELAGCQLLHLPGGLTVGDLAAAGQRSGLIFITVQGHDSAVHCALAGWERWLAARQVRTDEMAGTEDRNPASEQIDRLSALDLARLINREDERPARAVASQLPQIAVAVEMISERLRRGGRLLYIGAGTSGRLGVLDASEIPPTYGASPDLVKGIIAGGQGAVQGAQEGVEDDGEAGAAAIAAQNTAEPDAVVGIAASGSTPFVLGALSEARQRGALVIALVSSQPSPMADLADITIAPLTGPEVITGSTRMKAGTAQKMVLNMLSTGVMVRLGKTYGNLMVDVQPNNAKLRARAQRIVSQACEIRLPEATLALEQAGGEVKTAIVAVRADVSPEDAREALARSGGVIRKALERLS